MKQSQPMRRIDPLLRDSCTALLDSYGVVVSCDGQVDRAEIIDEGLAAFIGFLGDTLRGSLLISAPAKLIAESLPLESTINGVTEEAQRDWACELANQLLGRLKLKLAMYGVHFEMSTPSAVMGRELRGFRSVEGTHVLRFSVDNVALYVELDLNVSADFQMLDAPLPDEVSVLEGEMLMLI